MASDLSGYVKTANLDTSVTNLVGGMGYLKSADLGTQVADLTIYKNLKNTVDGVPTLIADAKDEAIAAAADAVDDKGFALASDLSKYHTSAAFNNWVSTKAVTVDNFSNKLSASGEYKNLQSNINNTQTLVNSMSPVLSKLNSTAITTENFANTLSASSTITALQNSVSANTSAISVNTTNINKVNTATTAVVNKVNEITSCDYTPQCIDPDDDNGFIIVPGLTIGGIVAP